MGRRKDKNNDNDKHGVILIIMACKEDTSNKTIATYQRKT